MNHVSRPWIRVCLLSAFLSLTAARAETVSGWLEWRGPNLNGISDEKGLPDKWSPGAENSLWTVDLPGQSTPVIANGKLYVMGYVGEGPDLQEGLFCLDAETGKPLWDAKYNDFLSDIIYTRYASSAPAIDRETGNVFMQGTQGILAAYTPDGKLIWSHSMMEEYGRLTFPNGRTSSPVIDGELVIVGGITANWGAHGPGTNRYYAFDKNNGALVWASQPGDRPKDSSFSTPVMGWYKDQRVFWAGGGDGQIYCVNARTGDPIWRFKLSMNGVNATCALYKDTVIAIHGHENIAPDTTSGRMVCLKWDKALPPGTEDNKTAYLTKEAEVWRNPVGARDSTPVVVGNRIYQVDETGKLVAIDADTGKTLWHKELGIEQRHASPVFADGKLYVPLLEGDFYIIKPGETDCEILSKVKLEGRSQGSPSIWNGRVYVQTTAKLYCIGGPKPGTAPTMKAEAPAPTPGPLAKFLVVPADILMRPDGTQPLRLIGVDAHGNWLKETFDSAKAKWEGYIPPTAKVKSSMNAKVVDGALKADPLPVPSAGAIKGELNGATGITRGRVLQGIPINQDFEKFTLTARDTPPNDMFAYPPLPWIGARFKWEIREKDGNKCLVKTTEDKFFQRATTFISVPELSNYTVQADVMSDGQVRKVGGKEKIAKMSEVGLVNQRYIIVLKGSSQEIEVNSNAERIKQTAPFAWSPNVWYTLKTRVDVDPATGAGTIRGKAWKKGDPEPEKWSIEVQHKIAHKNGSPGLFGFSPTDMPVYVDNLKVTPN